MLNYNQIQVLCLNIIHSKLSLDDKLLNICKTLDQHIEKYDWTGFYMTKKGSNTLCLGPYIGAETEHTEIPFGKGICGQAAESKKTFLIDDVNAEDNYISCNINVKSEIVVPILRNGIVLGQIDIDSNTAAAFNSDDQQLLECLCKELAPYI